MNVPARNYAQERIMEARGFIVVSKAAEIAGRSPPTIYKWLDEGKVVGTRVAGTRYVELESLKKHLGPEFIGETSEPSEEEG